MEIVLKRVIAAALILSLTACATPQKGALLGAAVGGAAAGLVVSSQDGRTNEQRATGLAIGALVGGAIGYLASKDKQQHEQMKRTDPQQMQFAPKLKRPEVRKVWVPDQIVGDEYVSGHWKFILEKNAVWTKED